MKHLIILIVIASIGCTSKTIEQRNRLLYDETTQTMHIIPEYCFDENGDFQEDYGHDTLDCGNLL